LEIHRKQQYSLGPSEARVAAKRRDGKGERSARRTHKSRSSATAYLIKHSSIEKTTLSHFRRSEKSKSAITVAVERLSAWGEEAPKLKETHLIETKMIGVPSFTDR
jgi:hypothetical protein